MKLTFEQIYDYTRCPLSFNFKHLMGLDIPINLYDQFDKAVIKAVLYFYYHMMDGQTVITSAQLKRRWEGFWGQEKEEFDAKDFVLRPMFGSIPMDGHKNRRGGPEAKQNQMMLRGWSILNNFHRVTSTNPGSPVAVDLGFELEVGSHTITDTIQLARSFEKKTELLILSTRQSTPTDFEIRNDFRTTFQAYAFRKIFNMKEDVITYYYLEKGKKVETIRTQRDFVRLEKTISNVVRSIEANIWFPRQTYFCHNCNFCQLCEQWEG